MTGTSGPDQRQGPGGHGGNPADATPPDGLPPRERMLALLAIALAMTMAILDGAIVNVALPVMAKDLAVSPGAAIFVVNGYQIAVTAALLPLASLGDILGYRRVYLGGSRSSPSPRSPARSRRASTC